jgi:hypothetical protein
MTKETESLLTFPCDFPIKAMGKTVDDLDLLVVGIVRKHVPDLLEGAVTTRMSKKDRFMSVTVTIQAENQQQIDNIYRELSAHEKVLIAL